MICQPAQDIALGKYGRTPGPINPAILELVEKQTGKKRIDCRPADLLEPGLEGYRSQCAAKKLPTDDETAVLYAMFPQQVEALYNPNKAPAAEAKPAAQPAPAPAAVSKPASPAPAASANGTPPGMKLDLVIDGHHHTAYVETL
jgi:pyruvate/oxaloacetate carboxyltransferase